MIRKLKTLGLALVAIFAMSSVAASSALAVDLFTVNGGGTAWLTGASHDNKFEIPGSSSFECTTSKFTSTVTNGASEATVLPTYNGTKNVVPHTTHCSASLGSLTIDTDPCHYVLTGNTTKGDPTANTDAEIKVNCPAGSSIKITAALGCTITIGTQTIPTGGVTYANVANHPGGSAVKVTATATGIAFTSHSCFGLVPAAGNNAKYTGTVTVTGFTDSGGTLTAPTEGAQKAISQS